MSAVSIAFKGAGEHLKTAAKSLWGAAKYSANGTKEALKSADHYVKTSVQQANGSYGKAIKGIYTNHPVTASLATVGAVGGLAYGGYKVVGHFTGREAERREARSQERDR